MKHLRLVSWLSLVVVAVLVVGAGLSRFLPVLEGDHGSTISVTPIAVIDGDTIDVLLDGMVVRVRILGIDAPEISHGDTPADCGGDEAAAHLTGLLDSTAITLTADPQSDSRDRYGRLLRYVKVSGRDIGLTMIQDGYAAAWYPSAEPIPARYNEYKATEHIARSSSLGSWESCTKLGR